MTAEEQAAQQRARFEEMYGLMMILGGTLPKHLEKISSINFSKVIRYESVERAVTTEEVKYITGDTLEKLAANVNKFLKDTPGSSRDGNPFQTKTGFVQTVSIATETGSGVFVPVVVFEGGDAIELNESQNLLFRRVWNHYAEMADRLFNLSLQMYAPAQAADANPTGETNQ